jgi:hypothetical protein
MHSFGSLLVFTILMVKLLVNAQLENESNRNLCTGLVSEFEGETEEDAQDILEALLGWPDE